jgi:hypothetical protein
MGKPRLPWKRGPVAGRIAARADALLATVARDPRNYLSLRGAARCLEVSTQPVRDWVRLGFLTRDGPRGRFSKSELTRFIHWVAARVEPFDSWNYTRRLLGKRGRHPLPFARLMHAEFRWPQGRTALTPTELAELTGCHPSLILKAIRHHGAMLGRRKTPGRWEITRQRWQRTFFHSRISAPRLPGLPRQPLFSTREAAGILSSWGVPDMSLERVRRMIRLGKLESIRPVDGRRKWRVPRKSLQKLRNTLLTT